MEFYIIGEMTLLEREEAEEYCFDFEQMFPESNPDIVKVYVDGFSVAETLKILSDICDEESEEPEVEGQ